MTKSRYHQIQLPLTIMEKEDLEKIADAFAINTGAMARKIIIDNLNELDKSNAEGIFLTFPKDNEEPLSQENMEHIQIYVMPDLYNRIKKYADMAELTVIRFARYCVVPYIRFYK